ncbi:MAG TPA: hypothetical protein VLH39_01590, partial [Magnetospirillaceae bacterium]|nr:hypothetical protein [Magnetospirillaceae bacterium]
MSGDLRERATGTAAAALIVALACAALASGALAVEQLEVRRVSASLAALGTASIVPPGTVLQVETAPARPYYPIRRAYRLELADGRLVGFG